MNKDVKIGLAVGLPLVLIVVGYFTLQNGEGGPDAEKEPTGVPTRPTPGVGSVKVKPVRAVAQRSPAHQVKPIRPAPAERPAPSRTASPSPIGAPVIRPPTTRPAGVAAAPDPTRLPGRTPTPIRPATGQPRITPPDRPGVYVVKAGDAGFWGVSQNVYGHGKYGPLIAKANPTADPTRLRPGQRLNIPPLPTETSPARPRSIPTGGQIYTVVEGDAGFWGIAEKVYGHGKYWPKLAEANADVNPLKLRPGQLLVIPALRPTAVPPAPRPAGRLSPGPGEVSPTGAGVRGTSSLPRTPRSQPAPPADDGKPVFD